MNLLSPNTEALVRQFETLASELPGANQAAVAERRRRALARFASLGLPSSRDDAWRYSAQHPVMQRLLPLAARPATPGTWPGLAAPVPLRLSFVDGHFCGEDSASCAELAAHGLTVRAWAEVLAAGETHHLDAFKAEDADGHAEWAYALQRDGALIHVATGARPPPLEIRCLASTAAGETARSMTLHVELAAGARLTLLESERGEPGARGLSFSSSRFRLARDAHLEHVLIQDQASGMGQFVDIRAGLADGAELHTCSLALGAGFHRYASAVELLGSHARVALNGLCHLSGRQHADHRLVVRHAGHQGRSEMYFRGLLDGHSRGIFSGKASVPPGVMGSVARQSSDHLLLSPHAEADSRPELSIENDAVECAHGATVGQLDETALFYLRARGIDPRLAQSMLSAAFALTVLERIQEPGIAAYARHILALTLPQMIDPEGLV